MVVMVVVAFVYIDKGREKMKVTNELYNVTVISEEN